MSIDVELSEEAYRASRVHKSAGNPLRYRILDLIAEADPISTSNLANTLRREVDSISYHVDKMKDKDLIYSEKRGRTSYLYIKRWDVYKALKAFEELFIRDEEEKPSDT